MHMDRTVMPPNKAEDHQQYPPPAATGQGSSLFNLSQLGNYIGKPLMNGMNLDELLLKNIISIGEGQVLPSPSSSSSSSSSSAPFFLGNFDLNGTLMSKKPVDQVQQQLALGENENGDPNKRPIMAIDPMTMMTQQTDWLQLQMAAVQQQHHQQLAVLDSNFNVPESVYESSGLDGGYAESQLAMTMPLPTMSTSPDSNQAVAAERKRRHSDEMMEKTIERRQKRMIKNRESAARSRARKQAYTHQLEVEVFRLRKTNNWLKKQKEAEMLLSSEATTIPKYQLRRTSSTSF